jgi:hypothetical protein
MIKDIIVIFPEKRGHDLNDVVTGFIRAATLNAHLDTVDSGRRDRATLPARSDVAEITRF